MRNRFALLSVILGAGLCSLAPIYSPSGNLTAPGPIGSVTPSTGAFTSVSANVGVVGVTTNSNAAAGIVGEYMSSLVASPGASNTNNVTRNVTSLTLTPGDWDVSGLVNFITTTATTTNSAAGISTTSATMPADGSEVNSSTNVTLTSVTDGIPLPRNRVTVASGTQVVYLVSRMTFSAGSVTTFGALSARRMR